MTGFKRLGRDPVYEGRFSVVRDTVSTPAGEQERENIHHQGAVAVVVLVGDGDVVLVRQYRAAVDEHVVELPAGKLDGGEDAETCARRELVEEVGLLPDGLVALGTYFVSPGWTDEEMILFFAPGATEVGNSPQSVEEAHMDILRVPLADALAMVRSGEIHDAKTMLGLLLARDHLESSASA